MSEPAPDAPIRIRAETSVADPDTCKFIVDRTVHPGGPVAFDRRGATDSSPLPARLWPHGRWRWRPVCRPLRQRGRYPF